MYQIEMYVKVKFTMFVKISSALSIAIFPGICCFISSTWAVLNPSVVSGTSIDSGSTSPGALSQSTP